MIKISMKEGDENEGNKDDDSERENFGQEGKNCQSCKTGTKN